MKIGIVDFNSYSYLRQSHIDQEYQVKRSDDTDETVPIYLWSGAPADSISKYIKKMNFMHRFLRKHAQKEQACPFTFFTHVVQVPEVFLGKTLLERLLSKVDGFVLSVSHLALTRCGGLLDISDSVQMCQM